MYATFSVITSGSNCNGFYTGAFNGNVDVTSDQDCVWVNATITGNVTQNGGNLVVTQTTVKGNVQITGAGTFTIGPSSAITGNLVIQNVPVGTAQNQVCGTTVTGDLQFHNNGTAVQIGSASPSCAGNGIGGNLVINLSRDLPEHCWERLADSKQCRLDTGFQQHRYAQPTMRRQLFNNWRRKHSCSKTGAVCGLLARGYRNREQSRSLAGC